MKIKSAFVAMPFILAGLLLAIWSGWARIGWDFPASFAGHHGALMTGSFLSTLIMLERVVSANRKALLILPLLNGLSALAFPAGYPAAGFALLIFGSGAFLVLCGYFITRYRENYYYFFAAGAGCLLAGNLLLAGGYGYPASVPWWIGFLLLTIVGERLELSRFLSLPRRTTTFLYLFTFLFLAGILLPFHLYGKLVFAAGLITIAGWLLRYDMALKSLHKSGQHRYSAILLITGYVWLLITAAFTAGGGAGVYLYDAALHSFFIGFVFSMIFSHAPIILPAVLRIPVKPYHPFLYTWFILLQLSLVLRIAGDLLVMPVLRKTGGLINGITILLFLVNMVVLVRVRLKATTLTKK